MHLQPTTTPRLSSRLLGTGLCCVLAVGACFADAPAKSADTVKVASDSSLDAEVTSDDDLQAVGEASASELSIGPLSHKIYPDDRPDWIVAEPVLDGDLHRWPVVSSPSLTEEASRESLLEQKRIAVGAYVEHLTNSSGQACQVIHFDHDYIDMHLLNHDRRYEGIVTTSGGEMFENAAELVFDEAFRNDVMDQWRACEVGKRLTGMGVLGAGSLALLMGLTSVLKVFHRVRR